MFVDVLGAAGTLPYICWISESFNGIWGDGEGMEPRVVWQSWLWPAARRPHVLFQNCFMLSRPRLLLSLGPAAEGSLLIRVRLPSLGAQGAIFSPVPSVLNACAEARECWRDIFEARHQTSRACSRLCAHARTHTVVMLLGPLHVLQQSQRRSASAACPHI